MKKYTCPLFPILLALSFHGIVLSQPNVVYITADDLSAIRLGCYGNRVIKTPNIDAFSKEALVFDRGYSQVPLCTPSRTSILTGVRPETSGAWTLTDPWRPALPNAVTLHRHFINNGYATAEIGKLMDPRAGDVDYPRDEKHMHGDFDTPDLSIQRLDSLAKTKKPFALFIGFGEPHPVHWDSPQKRERYQSYIKQYDTSKVQLLGPVPWTEGAGLTTKEALVTVYGVISHLDHEVGRVLQRIKDLGLWDNTITIFWAGDHGYRLGEASGLARWGKWYPDEICARIPLLMRVPSSVGNGKRTSGIVETLDMYPTLMDLCGLKNPPQKMEGQSFAPLFATPDRNWKNVAFTTYDGTVKSIATQRHRLIVSGGKSTLFDLSTDPEGLVDIASHNAPIVSQLKALLNAGPPPKIDSISSITNSQPAKTNSAVKFSISPGFINISVSGSKNMNIELFDLAGHTVNLLRTDPDNYRVERSRFGPGLYLLRVQTPSELITHRMAWLTKG